MALTVTQPSLNILSALAAPIVWFGKLAVAVAENNRYARQMQYLSGLSDKELEARGIKREDIAHHVFKELYYI
ncbi:hypothetical protein ATO10_00660 [Actibacterium atlanticum]|uniref:DUF1127 domain-containing protein n=1 Tax=Actibacterium atlanticum TaxID=1461693 RepID=A0A058ZQ16_9RHOB|nr:DUF1127 domain-containing protein [Actibacterium atlanticum]KCV83227.1 hypothetical protein ATO10_00660 [Actibacterium atlanticum]